MSIIQAYKSDKDGAIFEHLKDYEEHLKILKKNENDKKREEKKVKDREDFLINMCDTVKSAPELVKFIEDNIEFFIENARNRWGLRVRGKAVVSEVEIYAYSRKSEAELSWRDSISTYKKPMAVSLKSYDNTDRLPGFSANISFKSVGADGFASDLFDCTPINIGSGGGGRDTYSYSIDLFAHDFRLLSWCEMLKDFTEHSMLSGKRMVDVVSIARDYVDVKDPVFIEMGKELAKRDEKNWAQLEKILLEQEMVNSSANCEETLSQKNAFKV